MCAHDLVTHAGGRGLEHDHEPTIPLFFPAGLEGFFLPAIQDKPEARQLLHSLLRYMNSAQFDPKTTIDDATLGRILQ